MSKENISAPQPIRVFLSHSTHDLSIIKKISSNLNEYGLVSFIAHRDVKPSEEWQNKIFDELKSCHVFIPVLTDSFKGSDWTDQETGIAFTRSILIIPIKINYDPYGFIGRYQAIRLTESNNDYVCNQIVKIISDNLTLGVSLKYWLIDQLKNVDTFDDAYIISQRLLIVENFNQKEMIRILQASCNNNQVYRSFKAKPNIDSLLNRYSGLRLSNHLVGKWKKLSTR